MTRLPPRASVDVLLLDAGGVLVDPEWERVSRILARHGIDVGAEALAAAEPRAKWQIDQPQHIDGVDDTKRALLYYDLVLAGTGRGNAPIDPAVWADVRAEHARSNLWQRVLPGVPEALARVRQAGLPIVVVSNANGTAPRLLEQVGLAPYFETVLDSALEGVEKPDPEIFRRALARVGAAPERALHVGDLYHVDVLGARSAGIVGALVDPAGLYTDADCPRFASLPGVVEALLG